VREGGGGVGRPEDVFVLKNTHKVKVVTQSKKCHKKSNGLKVSFEKLTRSHKWQAKTKKKNKGCWFCYKKQLKNT
jgi:hypothetical protein